MARRPSLHIECTSSVSGDIDYKVTGLSATIAGSSEVVAAISSYIVGIIQGSSSMPSVLPRVSKPERYKGGLDFAIYDGSVSPDDISSDGVYVFAATVPNMYTAVSLKAWHVAAKVGTENNGNDGSNYWTIHICKSNHPTYTSLDSLNTSAMSTDDWETLSEEGLDISLNPDTEGQEALFIKVVKTGAPGNLSLAGPAVYVDL
jgi:hypothetical protein